MGNVLVAMGLQVTRIIDDDEDHWQSLWRGSAAEFFATAIFVFIGTGSVIAAKSTLGEDHIHPYSVTIIALAHGMAIMCMVYSVGEISGGHINPAVTWALLITDRLSIVRAAVYWVSQFTGALVGSAILKGLLTEELEFHMGCHMVNDQLTDWQGLGLEIVFTFIFVLVVFSTAISPFVGKMAPVGGSEYGPGKMTPFAVGATIMILILVGAPMTGGSMNPARSLGPAVVRGDTCWDRHWVYWFGPLIGSTSAAVIAQVLFLSSPEDIRDMLTATRGVNLMGVSRAMKAAKEDNSLQLDDTNKTRQRKNRNKNKSVENPINVDISKGEQEEGQESLENYVQADYEPQQLA
jgi:aquaporin TIP